MTTKPLFVLGSADPEMVAIEALLEECGVPFEYAVPRIEKYRVRRTAPSAVNPPCGCSCDEPTTVYEGTTMAGYRGGLGAFDEGCHHPSRWEEYLVGGVWLRKMPERVSPRTAYDAIDSIAMIDALGTSEEPPCGVVLVECDVHSLREELSEEDAALVRRIDHHRHGDPGFGKGPVDFLSGSSLGQVISELACSGLLPKTWEVNFDCTPALLGYFERCDVWTIGSDMGGEDEEIWPLVVPHDLVVTAACDHCLHHAWAGRCPGVTRDDVREFRALQAATRPVEPKSEEQYRADLVWAVAALSEAPTLDLDPCACGQSLSSHDRGDGDCVECGTPFIRVADMRAVHVPELPDAACYQSEPYIATVTDRDGRTKVVIGGAASDRAINAFMKQWGPAQGLTGIYGDPARGFAGGYLP
jgi:hypothetical protein